jgi:hypothetical protein
VRGVGVLFVGDTFWKWKVFDEFFILGGMELLLKGCDLLAKVGD